VTEVDLLRRCRWCGRAFASNPVGRPREYCRQACRQADYLARQRSADAGLSEAELIVAREQLDALHDQLYVLGAAVADVERDLAQSAELQDYQEALTWLLDAAKPLLQTRLLDSADPATG
jgi:hypothetical protein